MDIELLEYESLLLQLSAAELVDYSKNYRDRFATTAGRLRYLRTIVGGIDNDSSICE